MWQKVVAYLYYFLRLIYKQIFFNLSHIILFLAFSLFYCLLLLLLLVLLVLAGAACCYYNYILLLLLLLVLFYMLLQLLLKLLFCDCRQVCYQLATHTRVSPNEF